MPCAVAGGDGLLDQRRDVEALGGRPADEERVAAEPPVGIGDPGDLGRRRRRGPRPAGRRRRRRTAAACPCGSRSRARRASRAPRPSQATSRSDLTPDEAIRAGIRAAAARSAETSGGCGKPRWTPPRPPVPMKRIPTAAAAASVPPTVVAPTAPCVAQTARSRIPSLRAAGVNRSSSASLEPDPDLAVEHPDRGGDGARRANGLLAVEARRDPVGSGEAVRDERGLEGDDGALLLERRLHLFADADEIVHGHRSLASVGTEPGCWTQRAAAANARSGRRRASRRRRRRPRRWSRRSSSTRKRGVLLTVERRAGGAALEDPVARHDGAADDLVLVLVREDDVGRDLLELGAESLRPEVPDHAPRREVDADAGSGRARASIAAAAAWRTGSRSSA